MRATSAEQLRFTGVVAMDERRGIGLRGGIPWRLPEDMRLFKRLTMGHPLLMGRKTWESLGRPLPGRQNIVLTREASYEAPGAQVIHDVAQLEALELMDPEVMVIGGAQIYELMLPRMQKLCVSAVHGSYEADTRFPAFEGCFSRHRVQERFEGFDLVVWER